MSTRDTALYSTDTNYILYMTYATDRHGGLARDGYCRGVVSLVLARRRAVISDMSTCSCTVLYGTVLYCTVLYCTLLRPTAPYCDVLC